MRQSSENNTALFDLLHLLDDWRNITLAEEKAIGAEDWDALGLLQSKKSLIQELIDKADSSLKFSNPNARLRAEHQLKALADELLQLEGRNRQVLAEKIARTDSALKEMDKTSRSLRGVHKAYGSAEHSFWQAYS